MILNISSKVTISHNIRHEIKFNLIKKNHFNNFNNAYPVNWANIESQDFELVTKNDMDMYTNMWMDKLFNVNIGSPPQIVTN